jgi:serine protease
VLNLSLGATSPCESSYRDVIEELTARKVLVVISAGNEGTMVSSPGNCPGVAAIAALRHAGSKVGFSNLGPEVALGAPGGNCVNVNGGPCLFSLDTTSNAGSKAAAANTFTSQTDVNLGTSFSAPIVSGVAALMLSRNANLSTRQMLARLRTSARPFPTTVAGEPGVGTCHIPLSTADVQLEQCLCTTTTCGAGMVDAAAAVAAADRPIAAIALPASVSPGQDVTLSAAGSAAACNRILTGFNWSVVSPTVNPPAVVNADTAEATVVAPSSGAITLRLTVTDDQAQTDSADVLIQPTQAASEAPATAGTAACAAAVVSGPTPGSSNPTPSPPAPPRGGGGGGSIDGFLLAVLLFAALRRRRPLHSLVAFGR